MKRFVTYLYECEKGTKIRNVGFVRVNVRGKETTMEVCIRNLSCKNEVGKLYALIHKEVLLGIDLGQIKVTNGQCEALFAIQTDDIQNSGYAISEIEGMCIHLDKEKYIASCWKDEYANEIVNGNYEKEIKMEPSDKLSATEESLVSNAKESERNEEIAIYEKISLSEIRDLPSPNWHLATNSFLVHGVWNYGYLLLKKTYAESKERISLGVPGFFEKPEAVMAIYFGFPTFENMPSEVRRLDMNRPIEVEEIKKNQEAEEGTFGCWFVDLKL